MDNKTESEDYSFQSWLFSRQEIVEKTAGLVVLGIEILHNLGLLYSADEYKITFTHVLNLFFLVFIYFVLRKDFDKRFSVNPDNNDVARIIGLSHYSDKNRKNKIRELIFNANTFVSQLKNINYFLLATAFLYIIFLTQTGVLKLSVNENVIKFLINHFNFTYSELKNFKIPVTITFHLFVDLLSYMGAFYLLRCFYVMYLPTIDKQGNDILREKTMIYVLLGLALMVFDFFVVLPKNILDSQGNIIASQINNNGLFIAEFICGIVNSVVFILFIARFENKLLDIPPFVLSILYIYAILQSCLLFVTGNIFSEIVKGHKEFEHFLEMFSSTVLTLCLVGKITLAAVILYVLNTKRIFYYFLSLRKIHDEEEKHWMELSPLIFEFSDKPDKFSIIYTRNSDSSFTASMPNFIECMGNGQTTEDAKKDLMRKLKCENEKQG